MNLLFVLESPSKTYDKWIPRLLREVNLSEVETIEVFDAPIYHKPTVKEIKAAMAGPVEFEQKLFDKISSFGTDTPADIVISMGSAAALATWRTVFGKGQVVLTKLRNRVFEDTTRGSNPVKYCFTYSPKIIPVEPKFLPIIVSDLRWILGQRHVEKVTRLYSVDEFPHIALHKELGLDFETEGFVPYAASKALLTGAVSTRPGRGFGFNIGHPGGLINTVAKDWFRTVVENPELTLVGHEIKFDVKWAMSKCDAKLKAKLWDTKVAHALLDENSPDNSLKSLAAQYTDLGHYGDDVDRSDLRNAPLHKVIEYNTKDTDAPLRIKSIFEPEIKAQGMAPICGLLMESLGVLAKMEHRGMYVDRDWAIKEGVECYKELKKAEEELFRINGAEFNVNSTAQVADLLYNKLNIPILTVSKKTDAPSTSKDALLTLKYGPELSPAQQEALDALTLRRKKDKLWSTYFVTLPENLKHDNRIHTTYNLGKGIAEDNEEHGTVTGRLSSSNPNLQNIPIGSSMRGMFAATPGWRFAGPDYSQLELRVAAFVSQEPTMMRAFDEGKDIHTTVLADLKNEEYGKLDEMFTAEGEGYPLAEYEHWKSQRVAIKRINFGVLYGIGPAKLNRLLLAVGVRMTDLEIKLLMKRWFSKYNKVVTWIKKTENEALCTGKVRMPTGRIRHVLGASHDSAIGMRILRQAVNSPIQSTASDICLTAMNHLDVTFEGGKCDKLGQPQARLILQVHDMIGLEFNPIYYSDEEINETVKTCMESKVISDWKDRFGIHFNVPLGVSMKILDRWK
jgi:DNA polymerase-1